MEIQMHRLIVLAIAIGAAVCPVAPALARAVEPGDAAAVALAAPAVVSISVWQQVAADQPGGPPRRIKAYGSGFIVDPSGVIVTNKHVINGAFDVKATLSDGTLVSARLIAASALLDIAVLKVDVDHKLPSLEWGNSDDLQAGDPVLTVGNGLGWGTSVSAGIVSGLNRNLMDSPFDSYIQTDATINHGNSGGPLVNRDGKVVGIDTALFNPVGEGFIGIGFAIPASTAQYVAKQLVDPNHSAPGWLGFKLQDMTWGLAAALGVPYHAGAIVSSVDPSGPAAMASLQLGDVLKQLNGQPLTDSRAFMRAIAETPIGQPVHLTIFRGDKQQEVTATVVAWPNIMTGGMMTGQAAAAMMAMAPDPGMEIGPITAEARKQYGLSPTLTGVLITQVRPQSEASYLGVTVGDVITLVDRTPVAAPDDVHKAIKEAHDQDRAYLAALIQTKGGPQWISLSISARKS
jgi:serine protease Do